MAQKYFDASDHAVGTTLADLGFVPMAGATNAAAWSVVDHWAQGKSFVFDQSNTSALQFYALQDDFATEFEFLFQVMRRAGDFSTTMAATVKADDTYNWTQSGRHGRELRIDTGIIGGFTNQAAGGLDSGNDGVLQTWRIQLSQTQQKVKAWYGDLADEPATWDLETTVDYTARGPEYPAIGNRDRPSYDVFWFSWGTNGDPAPTEPVAAGPGAPTNLQTVDITATSARFVGDPPA